MLNYGQGATMRELEVVGGGTGVTRLPLKKQTSASTEENRGDVAVQKASVLRLEGVDVDVEVSKDRANAPRRHPLVENDTARSCRRMLHLSSSKAPSCVSRKYMFMTAYRTLSERV